MKTMNTKTLFIGLACLTLAACGQEEPAPAEEAVGEEAPLEETAVEEQVETVAEEAAEEEIEVVEESAAVVEDSGDVEIVLAQADVPAATPNYRYEEGRHYTRLVPTQPTFGGADKVEVVEFFMYSCPHCYEFEPTINRWDAEKPAHVRFVRAPVMWNDAAEVHAQIFYTAEALIRTGIIENGPAFHAAVFDAIHSRGSPLLRMNAIQGFFERFGVSETDFNREWSGFWVAQQMQTARNLAGPRRYNVTGVPAFVVNGKYRTSTVEAGTPAELISIINELVEREAAR